MPTSKVINTFLVKMREKLGSPISSFKIVRCKNSLQSCPIFFQQFSIMCGHTFIPHSREMLLISSLRGMQDSFVSKCRKCSCVHSGSHLKLEFALILSEDTNSTCLHKWWCEQCTICIGNEYHTCNQSYIPSQENCAKNEFTPRRLATITIGSKSYHGFRSRSLCLLNPLTL